MSYQGLLVETKTLHEVAKNPLCTIRFTRHGREEMAADGIVEPDVRRVLINGKVTWEETKKDVLWHVEGSDIDSRPIRLVVVVYKDEITVKLVTAMLLRTR